MLKYYGHSRIKALMDIYPDIGLEPARFQNMMGKEPLPPLSR